MSFKSGHEGWQSGIIVACHPIAPDSIPIRVVSLVKLRYYHTFPQPYYATYVTVFLTSFRQRARLLFSRHVLNIKLFKPSWFDLKQLCSQFRPNSLLLNYPYSCNSNKNRWIHKLSDETVCFQHIATFS